MTIETSIIEKVLSRIDRDELTGLVMALCDFNSPTGHERDVANFILHWFEKNGFQAIKQEVESSRFNAIGILKGTGAGPSLTINGHLDVILLKPGISKAYVEDGLVYGHEIGNMRAGLASFMIAAKAIKASGVKLRGDLILAGVVGEISTAPIGPFQGPQDRGEGLGTRHLLTHGVQSDFAVVADGSDFSILRAQAGVAYFKVVTTGPMLYTPFVTRTENPAQSQNAIIKMTQVIAAIENWAREYEQRTIYEFPGGRVEPKVVIGALQAGMPTFAEDGEREPFRPSKTPGNCELYLDVRLPPGMSPVEVKHELETLLRGMPFQCEIEMFRSQRGYEGKGPETDYLHSVVQKAHEYIFRSKPSPPEAAYCSMWTDTNVYWEMGIPAVKWGPSARGPGADRWIIEVENLVRAAKVYSLIALEICGDAETTKGASR